MAAVEDYQYWADRKKESIENNNGCICDNHESHKKETEWSFVDQDHHGRAVFTQSQRLYSLTVDWLNVNMHSLDYLKIILLNHLVGSEESSPKERIWDSTVNMYVASDTNEKEVSQEG